MDAAIALAEDISSIECGTIPEESAILAFGGGEIADIMGQTGKLIARIREATA